MGYEVSRLPGQPLFGAVVSKLTVDDLADSSVCESLRSLWIQDGVILFRGFEQNRDAHIRLSRVFGDLIDHVNSRETGSLDAETVDIAWTGEQELYAVAGEELGSWVPWHIDLFYTDQVNRGGLMRPVELPKNGGGMTGFIDRIAAYDALPDELKRRIEPLSVIYKGDFDATTQRHGKVADLRLVRASERLAKVNAKNFPRVVHPMVYVQAETGRKVLNVSPWFAQGIEGMPGEEGDALLAEVIDQCVSKPELSYFHSWTPDDMVLWDNWRMLHSCTGVARHDRRLLKKASIAGDYGLGRMENPELALPEALRRVNV